jgi:hypothetical protein
MGRAAAAIEQRQVQTPRHRQLGAGRTDHARAADKKYFHNGFSKIVSWWKTPSS